VITMAMKILLEEGVWLRYVRRDGRVEEFQGGRFETDGDYDVRIYDESGELVLDLPASEVRSCCVFDPFRKPIGGAVEPVDWATFFVASQLEDPAASA